MEERQIELASIGEGNCGEPQIQNIDDLGSPGIAYLVSPNKGCFYFMGEQLLNRLINLLGKEVTSAALRDIFLHPLRTEAGLPLRDKQIYQAFLNHVPPDQQAEFLSLFQGLHGSSIFDFEFNASDDHGDEPASATQMTVGEVRSGALETPFDTDYLRFYAERGLALRISVQHNVLLEDKWADLFVRLHPPTGPSEYLVKYAGSRYGEEVQWSAPESGEYYLSVESASGILGAYTVQIDTEIPGADDHGDAEDGATLIALNGESGQPEQASGTIGHAADLDYFRVEAVAGDGYEVEVINAILEYSRVDLERSDGGNLEGELGSVGWGLGRSDLSWKASESGTYYLIVSTPTGGTGDYTIFVTHTAAGGDDHGDTPQTATQVREREVVDATLEHSADVDIFRFTAQGGQAYNIRLDHLTTSYQPVLLLAPDGVTPLLEHDPFGPQAGGSFIPWIASETGDYFLVFQNPGGDTGDYNLAILPGFSDVDDHADISSAATDLAEGQEEFGSLDHWADYDWFRFQAQEGTQYEIALDYPGADSDIPDPRVTLHGGDGLTPEQRFVANARRLSGKYIQWVAPDSGPYYVAVWSPKGDVVSYTIGVSQPGP